MGRHELPKARRRSPVALAAVLAPAAIIFAAAADCHPVAVRQEAKPVVADLAPSFEIVAAGPIGVPAQRHVDRASRLRVTNRFLPVGVASERGMQVRTILVARAISAAFPQIHEIGGVRPDAKPWHPRGLAIDVMIPNPQSADGIALGNQIVAFVRANAKRFGMQDAIWRGVYYTPDGGRTSADDHFDHVHVTTTGGGYPSGQEVYLR